MQPTSNQTVPATTFVPGHDAGRQSTPAPQGPVPLSDDLLRQIGGGLTPNQGW